MLGYYQNFAAVSEMLIDKGLAEVKKELVYEHYLQDGVDLNGFSNAFYKTDADETLAAFKGRARGVVRPYIIPGEDAWHGAAGYTFFDPYVSQLAPINGYNIHWTLYQSNLCNLVGLRVDADEDNIINALIPNGAGSLECTFPLKLMGQVIASQEFSVDRQPDNITGSINQIQSHGMI